MGLRPQDRERGLAVLNETRQTRRRAVVFGRVRVREVATGFWIMTFVGLLVFSFAYYRYTLVELDARRSELLARQRAVAAAVGTGGFTLRDQLEAWIVALAQGLPEQIAADARLEDIANGPTIYVRLRQTDARDVASIRKGAARSVRDGFTSCLFVGSAEGQQGPACTQTSQCGPGEVCGDFRVCAAPAHPYNLRLLNEGLRVLEPEWLSALEAAKDDLQVRAIGFDLEDVAKHAAVAGAEVVRRSRYFTAVLDEEPAGGAAPPSAALAGESPEEQLQAIDHPVRVGIWDIQRGASLAVLRLEAAGRFVRLGSNAARDPMAVRAQQRQANNCAVATDVRGALAAGRVPSASDGLPGVDAPAPVVAE
jgi:hypothetical protein